MFPKKKYTKKSPLEKRLDDIFSIYIRLRDADDNGYCRCISCNKIIYWADKNTHNGHFEGRRKNNTRYSEVNCNAQCCSCNSFNEGKKGEYKEALINKFGIDKVNMLALKSIYKISASEYEILIKEYLIKASKLAYEKLQYDIFREKAAKYLGKKYVKEVLGAGVEN